MIFSQLLRNERLDGAKVLEVGCGTGRISKRIASIGADLTVLDIGESLVDKVSHSLSCTGVVGNACNIPFADQAFDVVVSSECIEHTPKPELAIEEMCRVCRCGGMVCITSPNRLWYPLLFIANRFGLRKFSGIENWIWPHKAKTVMVNKGFRDIVISGCHLWPFQIRFTHPLLRKLDSLGEHLCPFMINFGIVGRISNQ